MCGTKRICFIVVADGRSCVPKTSLLFSVSNFSLFSVSNFSQAAGYAVSACEEIVRSGRIRLFDTVNFPVAGILVAKAMLFLRAVPLKQESAEEIRVQLR